MAMGKKSVEEFRRAVANHRTYLSGTGSLGAYGASPRKAGWLDEQYRDSARRATYTVFSYETPIGWAIEDPETGAFERVIPDQRHSATTSNHQTNLRVAWADSYHDGTAEGRRRWLKEHRNEESGYSHPSHP